MIPNEDINQIRSKANIVDIISSYINLEPKGKNYFGLCPFHDDNNPSMSVSPEKQIYTCFVCGASGNVFSFVQDYENVTFPESVKAVANKIGYNLNIDVKTKRVNEKYFEILDIASKYYINNLNSKDGNSARKYLNNRNLSDEIINTFKIGVAFSDNNLSKLLTQKGYTINDLTTIGLSGEGYSIYDIFQNKIIFPITNERGEVIAFSGRIYNNEEGNKYVNSKESIIFKKGNVLYNYDKAKSEVNKKKEVYVVEGFLDAIKMHSIGVKNVVATMGTALTKEHTSLLKKLNAKIILLFDNDDAGEKSTLSAGEEMLKANLDVHVVRLSGEKDPDDYIVNKGEVKFKDALKETISFFDFKINYLRKSKDLNQSKDLANYINTVIDELNKTDDEILRDVTINNLVKEFGVDKELILSKLTKNVKPIVIKPKPKKKVRLSANKKLSETVIYIMMQDVKYITRYEKDLGYIPDKVYNQIASDIVAFYKINKEFNIADFISFISESDSLDIVLRIINDNENTEPIYEEFDDYLNMIHKWIKSEQINNLKNSLKLETDANKRLEINDLIIKIKRESDL